MTFVRAVGALEAEALAESAEGFLGNDMSARQHHRWVLVRGLLFGDRADKDRMKEERRRQGDFNLEACQKQTKKRIKRRTYRKLILTGPLRPFGFHDGLQFQERGECNGTRRRREVQRRVSGQSQERAKFTSEELGDIFPRGRGVEERCVWRSPQVGSKGHGPDQLLNLAQIAGLKDLEFLSCIFQSGPPVTGAHLLRRIFSMVDRDKPQTAELEFQVAAASLQRCAVLARPLNRWDQVLVLAELVEDVVHGGELFADLGRGDFVDIEKTGGEFGGRWGWIVGFHRFLVGDFREEGCGNGELTFAEEVDSNRTIDQVLLRRESVVLRAWKWAIFEQLG